MTPTIDTEYDWAKAPPYNGSDLPSPEILEALLLPDL